MKIDRFKSEPSGLGIKKLINQYKGRKGALIDLLQDIQAEENWLPEDALRQINRELGLPLSSIYGVATFYKAFSLKPRGKHLITVCQGTACHVRGAPHIVDDLQNILGIAPGETTPDKLFTLETVNCLGACALGPIIVVDGHYFSNVHLTKVKEILQRARAGLDKVEIQTDLRIFPLEVGCPRCNHSLMDQDHLVDCYPSIRVTVSFENQHGWMNLSCLYGSYNHESEHEMPTDSVVNFFCPYCHAELLGGTDCSDCSAPMVPMIVRGGGMLQICSRRGCKGHLLDLSA